MIGRGALIMGSPDDALARSVMMTDERKNYLAERSAYWAEQEDANGTTRRAFTPLRFCASSARRDARK